MSNVKSLHCILYKNDVTFKIFKMYMPIKNKMLTTIREANFNPTKKISLRANVELDVQLL
jgi:hypothetical protein